MLPCPTPTPSLRAVAAAHWRSACSSCPCTARSPCRQAPSAVAHSVGRQAPSAAVRSVCRQGLRAARSVCRRGLGAFRSACGKGRRAARCACRTPPGAVRSACEGSCGYASYVAWHSSPPQLAGGTPP
eukprot:3937370-Rhodomonas_salina.4